MAVGASINLLHPGWDPFPTEKKSDRMVCRSTIASGLNPTLAPTSAIGPCVVSCIGAPCNLNAAAYTPIGRLVRVISLFWQAENTAQTYEPKLQSYFTQTEPTALGCSRNPTLPHPATPSLPDVAALVPGLRSVDGIELFFFTIDIILKCDA